MTYRMVFGLLTSLGVLLLMGCSAAESHGAPSLTWQNAKAETQRMESEIASLFPHEQVLSVEQQPTGLLLSCDSIRHQWVGKTIVTISPSADVNALITDIGAGFAGNRSFEVSDSNDINGHLRVQLIANNGEESYLISRGREADEIGISSGSRCFTLPEGVYPRGDF